MFIRVTVGKGIKSGFKISNFKNAGLLKQVRIGRQFSKQETGVVGWRGERDRELGSGTLFNVLSGEVWKAWEIQPHSFEGRLSLHAKFSFFIFQVNNAKENGFSKEVVRKEVKE